MVYMYKYIKISLDNAFQKGVFSENPSSFPAIPWVIPRTKKGLLVPSVILHSWQLKSYLYDGQEFYQKLSFR